MNDVKVKNHNSIKTIEKKARDIKILGRTVKKLQNTINNQDQSVIENGNNIIMQNFNKITDQSIHSSKKIISKSYGQTGENIEKSKKQYNKIKNYFQVRKRIKELPTQLNINNLHVNTLKLNNKKYVLHKKQKIISFKLKKNKSIKKVASLLKSSFTGTKILIDFIISLFGISISIIIFLSLIGLLIASPLGIFFGQKNEGVSIQSVIKELNLEMAKKISYIHKESGIKEYILNSNRADWKDVLSIFALRVNSHGNDLLVLDEKKVSILKETFWSMNTITTSIKEQITEGFNIDGSSNSKKVLEINISGKKAEEMLHFYHFTSSQKLLLNDLLDSKIDLLWNNVITSDSLQHANLVNIALLQVGNVGGELYWRWYGFDSRVEWCAIFVSWVANQAGYIEKNIVPKFSGVQNGISWFQAVGGWKDKNYIPESGDIIFFDWEGDGISDHVGIVEKINENKIYTIEGNSDDECKQKEYDINSQVIFGYGTF